LSKPPTRLTAKSTKEDILKAYAELKDRYQEQAALVTEKKAEVAKASETALVEKASTYTVDSIIKGLADLNCNVGKALTDLASLLTVEADKLGEIRSAIEIETRKLRELYDIDVAAETLALLIQDHEEKKSQFEAERAAAEARFETETSAKRAEWKKDQEAYQAALKENDARIKKEREREKEEYEYNLVLARKKDNDLYMENKSTLEKELQAARQKQEQECAARETALTTRETELAELRTRMSNLPAELSTAIEQARKETATQCENQFKQEAILKIKENETDKRVAELRIASLEETASKQALQIETLTRKLEDSSNQVQAIAVKAIEGASNARALNSINEIAMEQAKNMSRKG
jgi:hypothetical protein